MTKESGAPASAPSPASTPWGIGVEVDLHTALALARASAVTLQNLSPESRRKINEAIEREAALLEIQADPLSRAAAQSLLQVIREAA
jgi:hypothetical protein